MLLRTHFSGSDAKPLNPNRPNQCCRVLPGVAVFLTETVDADRAFATGVASRESGVASHYFQFPIVVQPADSPVIVRTRAPALEFNAPSQYGWHMIATSYRYIVRKQGVRSGHAIVEGTRIGVHDVVGLLQNGETVETIVTRCFPNLTLAQVYECLAYYEDHRGEIDVLVARQMAGSAP